MRKHSQHHAAFSLLSCFSFSSAFNDSTLEIPGVVAIKRILDTAVISASLVACTVSSGQPFTDQYLYLLIISALLGLHIFDKANLYRTWPNFPTLLALNSILLKWSLMVGCLLAIAFSTKVSTQFSRKIILSWIAVTPFALVSVQILARNIFKTLVAKAEARRAIIIGANQIGYELFQKATPTPI
jgi:putative colanic acid biosynthesis UDP-glucose lipid carrier transferase